MFIVCQYNIIFTIIKYVFCINYFDLLNRYIGIDRIRNYVNNFNQFKVLLQKLGFMEDNENKLKLNDISDENLKRLTNIYENIEEFGCNGNYWECLDCEELNEWKYSKCKRCYLPCNVDEIDVKDWIVKFELYIIYIQKIIIYIFVVGHDHFNWILLIYYE